ncbi:lysophospholipase [Ochrobactrum daejeonense]|uniref:Lysophospholipase n=1 Tax=Brucella daejeonensis TaxID=659015 RepID=A0A7W9EML2_9HYPH|nr:alpha/beta hydrolase [Brucella daejeonensis]MBB5703559.1 lysophospholipase [Brucella daejeonensis]
MSELLFETDANPIPQGIRAGLLDTPDGKTLRYAILKPETRPVRGTIVLLQGRNEFIEKYFETMADLTMRGFTVVTFDWRGQGGSYRLLKDRMRGYVRRFDDYCDDLDLVLDRIALPDCPPPFHVLGHSAGGLVALSSVGRLGSRITRMVLCAPFLGLAGQKISDDNVRRIASIFCRVGLGRIYASGGRRLSSRPFAGNPLTSDPARFMRNMEMARLHPDLALGGPTAQWLYNALDTARRVNRPDFHEGPRMPVLIVAAGADRVVSTPVIERFVARTRNVSLVTITGARHEMLQETDFYREQLWAAFDAFIPEASDVETMPETLEP